MARAGGAGAAVVAPLLQERFRQLQRMKELREEKELLMRLMLYTPLTTTSSCNYYELLSAGTHVMFLPPKPHCKLSLSLCPAADCRTTNQAPSDLSRTDQNSASDIDTSLHL